MVSIVLFRVPYLIFMSPFVRSINGAPCVSLTVDGMSQIAWGMSEGVEDD
jgi:hypothetical protein